MPTLPSPSASSPTDAAPPGALVAHLRAELMRHVPFSGMPAGLVDRLILGATELYYAPDEVLLSPDDGPVQAMLLIREGAVSGATGGTPERETQQGAVVHYETGDCFPIGALLGHLPVSATYRATRDTFLLRIPLATVEAVAAASPPFAEMLSRRMMSFIKASRLELQRSRSAEALSEQSMEQRLGDLRRVVPHCCTSDTPLAEALGAMHSHRVGSMLVVDGDHRPQGILTRHDILGRITLPQLPLATPIAEVMTRPVHVLTIDDTAHDAVLLMSRQGLRHVPIVDHDGRLASVVSERDLFVMQRASLKHLSTTLRTAGDLLTLRQLAGDIRRYAGLLLTQGVQARSLTELVSHLNDLLAQRVVGLIAAQMGCDLGRACWLSFGSEGRSEQTLATDQDNGLIFLSEDPEADRPAWLAFGRAVNEALDACGYPLCKGNIMASNPACCLTPEEWQQRMLHWIDHGSPEDLLAASIYFDMRPLAGNLPLAHALRAILTPAAQANARFRKQLADNLLRNRPALNWLGQLSGEDLDGVEVLDLKRHGTALFVDVARLMALAQGVTELNTRRRLEAAGRRMALPAPRREAWMAAFEVLQMLRLRVQMTPEAFGEPLPEAPNAVRLQALNNLDRRVLKEAMNVARRLQQRVELDYP